MTMNTRLGTIHLTDPLGNRSRLTVDATPGGALCLRLTANVPEALANLGPCHDDLPTCAAPDAFDEVCTVITSERCYRSVTRIERPKPLEDPTPAHDAAESVDDGFTCPACGEDDMDQLVWINDDEVACQSCRQEYRPSDGAMFGPWH